jgi:hypothetical protein
MCIIGEQLERGTAMRKPIFTSATAAPELRRRAAWSRRIEIHLGLSPIARNARARTLVSLAEGASPSSHAKQAPRELEDA